MFYYVCEMMWSASVLLRARSVSRNDVVCKCFITCRSVSRNDVVCRVFYYVRGVCQEMMCQEMMWSASVLLRARSVSRLRAMMWSVVCKCFITCEECVKSVLLRARSVSRNDVVCKCFITCEECVKK